MPLPRANNSIQRYFIDDLTRQGLDEVDESGINRLATYAADFDIDRFEARPDAGGGISQLENQYLQELLTTNELRGFLTIDGRQALETLLNMRGAIYGGLSGHEVTMPEGSLTQVDLRRVSTNRLAAAFLSEVEARGDIFKNPRVSAEEKGKKLYFLFKDYTMELNRRPSGAGQQAARAQLLDAVRELPAAQVFLLHDHDGDRFNTAHELVHNTDPGKPQNEFPRPTQTWSTYQSMHGTFYAAAEKIDRVLEAMGLPAKVAEHEHRSAVAWLMGERAGNTMTSSIEESRAISSTAGLDFVKGLFPSTHRVAGLELVEGFDIAVDFFDAAGGFVSFDRSAGDRMQALAKSSGEVLRARIEEVAVEGEPRPRYRPVFEKASGEVVPEDDVKLVIMDRFGHVKGDGKAESSHASGWWGFCDRNTLNALVTARYGFPMPTQDVTLTVGNETVAFSPTDIVGIVGRRLTEIFSSYDYTGERYDDVLSTITLKDGTQLLGRFRSGEIDLNRPDALRSGDLVTIQATGGVDAFSRLATLITRLPGKTPEDPARLVATGPKGDRFEVRSDEIPGGFGTTARRPIAWQMSATDAQRIAALVLPVAESEQVFVDSPAPSAEELRSAVSGILDSSVRDAPDVQAVAYRKRAAILLENWARRADGKDARGASLKQALGLIKDAYSANPAGTARDAAIAVISARDPFVREMLRSLHPFVYAFERSLAVGDEEWWRVEEEVRRERFFTWFDPADSAKVELVDRELRSSEIANHVGLLLDTLPRDAILSGLESLRAEAEAANAAKQRTYLDELAAHIGRIEELSLCEDISDSSPSRQGKQTTTYVLRSPAAPGDSSTRPSTITVSEHLLGFDGLRNWNDIGTPAVKALRKALLELLKGLSATAPATKTEEQMTFETPAAIAQTFDVAVSDGTQRSIRSNEILEITKEVADDVTLDALIAHVKRHGGATNADSWMWDGVSNGLQIFTSIRDYGIDDQDAPDWISKLKDKPLFGQRGEVKRPENVRFFDLGYEVDGNWSSGTRGWIEMDADNMPKNSGIVQGMYDFLWSVEGAPDWNSTPTFNPNVPNDLVLRLYLRSVPDQSKLESLANQKLLPENWRDYLA